MCGAGAGSRNTDPETAREFGLARGHEGSHLLVSRLDEPDLAVSAVERAEDAVNAVAGIAEEMMHALLMQTLHNEIADGQGHGTAR